MRVGQRVTPTGVLAAPASIPEREWLALRRTGIGGSDVAALLGLNRYTSPRELYLDKRGELPPVPRPPGLERAAAWGHLHEPLIAARFAQAHGLRVRRIGMIRHHTTRWMLASLDRQVLGCDGGSCFLEIKNRSAFKRGEWGESGDPAGVPDTEALQTHWYLHVTGYTHGHVAVLINGNDDRYYRVDCDRDLAGDVVAVAARFWQRVQDGDPPPVDGAAAVTELLASLWPGEPDTSKVVDPIHVKALKARRAVLLDEATSVTTAITAIENEMRDILGDAETAIAGGEAAYTWRRNGNFASRKFATAHPDLAARYTHLVPAIDTAALATAHPDLYRAFRARVLRIPPQEAP